MSSVADTGQASWAAYKSKPRGVICMGGGEWGQAYCLLPCHCVCLAKLVKIAYIMFSNICNLFTAIGLGPVEHFHDQQGMIIDSSRVEGFELCCSARHASGLLVRNQTLLWGQWNPPGSWGLNSKGATFVWAPSMGNLYQIMHWFMTKRPRLVQMMVEQSQAYCLKVRFITHIWNELMDQELF